MHTQNKITAAGHTAGTWKAIGGRVDGPDCYPAPLLIATCSLTHKVGENEANARLIAAAPELFGVVERLASWSGSEDVMSVSVREELVRQARAAIARAKGVQS